MGPSKDPSTDEAKRRRHESRWGRDEAKQREAAAARRAERERAERADERLKAQARADLAAGAERRAAEAAELAAMTPEQRTARYLEQQAHPPAPGLAKPRGYYAALEAVRREDAEREREQLEQRERDLGLPKMQAKWEARQQEIAAARDTAIREAAERCRAEQQAAHDKAERALEQLGPRPTLESLEVPA